MNIDRKWSFYFFAVLGIEPRATGMLGERFTTELQQH